MEQPIVRLATIEDLPWIRQLYRRMVEENPFPYPTNVIGSLDAFTRSLALALIQAPPTAWVFLAYADSASAIPDAMFGYEVQTRSLGEPSRLAFIHFIYTVPEAERRGLATTLLELGGEHMAAQGLQIVEATSVPGDLRFAPDLGFTIYEHRAWARVDRLPEGVARRRARAGNGHTAIFDVPPALDPEDDADDRG